MKIKKVKLVENGDTYKNYCVKFSGGVIGTIEHDMVEESLHLMVFVMLSDVFEKRTIRELKVIQALKKQFPEVQTGSDIFLEDGDAYYYFFFTEEQIKYFTDMVDPK